MLVGGPCFTKLMENAKQNYCVKCTVFERIDRDYLDCVTEFISNKSEEANKKVRLVYQPKEVPVLQSVVQDDEPMQEWSRQHGYHLSWAVFKHLPCKYYFPFVYRSCIFV